MELTNRILKIMENSGLTPSEFADKIEVQRSAISHITSGRNKPSLDFLIKIKQAFPEIDTDWLIFGIEKEEVPAEISSENQTISENPSSFPTLLDLFEPQQTNIPEQAETKHIKETKAVEKSREDENLPSTQVKEPIAVSSNLSSRKIVKTILLYNDGTFEEFVPSV